MRPVTRNLVVALLVLVGLLLALGAVPSLLRSGDPYYVEASPAVEADAGANRTAVNVSDLSERRYPYLTSAVAAAGANASGAPGRSDPYWRGPFGLKGAFTHSPFDEFAALREQSPDATTGSAVYARSNGTLYRVAIVRENEG